MNWLALDLVAIRRTIRKRMSTPRNPSWRWISIKKSKSDFTYFLFNRFIGKSEVICKTVLVKSVVIFLANYACACETTVLKNCAFCDYF